MSHTTTDTRTPSADAAEDADYEDGPPAMGVVILLCTFMAGMALGGWLAWIR